MQKIITFLTFNNQAEEAVNLYTSIFKNSKIIRTSYYGEAMPALAGTFMTADFEIEGQRFCALNAGPHFTFSLGISLFVNCNTQDEIDELWEKLSEGGHKDQCGWLQDKFGVSWQIVPSTLGEMIGDKDPVKAKRVMEAMLKMNKLDIRTLQEAYYG